MNTHHPRPRRHLHHPTAFMDRVINLTKQIILICGTIKPYRWTGWIDPRTGQVHLNNSAFPFEYLCDVSCTEANEGTFAILHICSYKSNEKCKIKVRYSKDEQEHIVFDDIIVPFGDEEV